MPVQGDCRPSLVSDQFTWSEIYKNRGNPTVSAPKKADPLALPITPMDTGLTAVALVIRSRDGPQFVFHYPPRPSIKARDRNPLYGTDLHNGVINEVHSTSEDSDDSDFEAGQNLAMTERFATLEIKEKGVKKDKGKKKAHHQFEELEGDEHIQTSSGEHVVPWEHLFEFHTEDLESILTPARAYHKRMFDLSLDPLHFITYPIHIREHGTWKKKRAKKAKKSSKDTTPAEPAADDKGNESDEGGDDGGMTMFNVVFIVDVGKKGAQARVNNIYEHIAKKFNKALLHAQEKSNYVWKESEMILSMKEKAKESRRPMSWLWNEIMLDSTLAAAIRDVYNAVAHNKIANVHFGTTPPLDLSLQIPIPSFLTRLPTFLEKGVPGILVTSANPMINEEGEEDPTYLNKHFALLLLGDEAKIVAEIQADNTDLAAPLIECIRLCKPTLSFAQVAQTKSVDLDSLLTLAQHLIYWRRAMAIPPLHGREVYIVNPNSDNRKLPTACIAWKKAFPLAPSLTSFLAALSSPRPYKSLAPSKDHRATYIEMLAWLYRGGWVTQLRMFAWIVVWPEIIYEVQYQLKAEAQERAKRAGSSDTTSSDNTTSSTESTDESDNDRKAASDPNATMSTEQAAEKARLERLAAKTVKDAADEADAFAKMAKPVATEDPSINQAEHLEKIDPYIIKDPHKTSNEESLYIKAIGARFTYAKAKEYWPRFTKYFNGLEALEGIALKENMKRKEAMNIILEFQEHLLVFKHW